MTTQVPMQVAAQMLPHFIAADTPVLFIGPPGVGKTEILTTYAKSQGIYAKVIHGSHYTPTDVLGIGVPDAEREYAKFLAPELFRELREAARHGPTMLFIDEINTAAPVMQSLFLQLVNERRAAGHELPEGCFVAMAGNRQGDGGQFYMSPILTNRVAYVEVTAPSAKAWGEWAMVNGVHPVIVSYIMANPDRLFDYDASRFINATPRQWERVSRVMHTEAPSTLRMQMMAAQIGPSALELEAIIRLHDELPSIKQIFKDPENTPVPQSDMLDALYLTASMMVQAATIDDAAACATYMLRMPQDIQMMIMVSMTKRSPDVARLMYMENSGIAELARKVGGLFLNQT